MMACVDVSIYVKKNPIQPDNFVRFGQICKRSEQLHGSCLHLIDCMLRVYYFGKFTTIKHVNYICGAFGKLNLYEINYSKVKLSFENINYSRVVFIFNQSDTKACVLYCTCVRIFMFSVQQNCEHQLKVRDCIRSSSMAVYREIMLRRIYVTIF